MADSFFPAVDASNGILDLAYVVSTQASLESTASNHAKSAEKVAKEALFSHYPNVQFGPEARSYYRFCPGAEQEAVRIHNCGRRFDGRNSEHHQEVRSTNKVDLRKGSRRVRRDEQRDRKSQRRVSVLSGSR